MSVVCGVWCVRVRVHACVCVHVHIYMHLLRVCGLWYICMCYVLHSQYALSLLCMHMFNMLSFMCSVEIL